VRFDGAPVGYLRRTMTPAQVHDELFTVWSAARAEANLAYAAWCDAPGSDAYVVYRAAEDRADAAEHALATTVLPLLVPQVI
jgi:hypothetical protein